MQCAVLKSMLCFIVIFLFIYNDFCNNLQIIMKECHNEDAQCAFIVDKISEISSNHSADNCSYGNIAILYRRRVMFLDTITM